MKYIVILNEDERDLLMQDLFEMNSDNDTSLTTKSISKAALHKLLYAKTINEDFLNAGVKRIDKTQMKDIPKRKRINYEGGVIAEEAMKATDNYATGSHFTCE